MKYFILLFFICLNFNEINAQSPIGIWVSVDDETGKEKAHIKIYEVNGKIYGSIFKILVKPEADVCILCSGAKKDKPLIGLVIIEGLKKNGKEWSGGTILDPRKGKEYKCLLSFEDNDKLKVRGYVGFSLLGRTQYWKRLKKS